MYVQNLAQILWCIHAPSPKRLQRMSMVSVSVMNGFCTIKYESRCHFISIPYLITLSTSWFNHTGGLRDQDRDLDRDMDEWVVRFYAEPFTPHLNMDRGQHLLSPIVLSSAPCLCTRHSQCDYTSLHQRCTFSSITCVPLPRPWAC